MKPQVNNGVALAEELATTSCSLRFEEIRDDPINMQKTVVDHDH